MVYLVSSIPFIPDRFFFFFSVLLCVSGISRGKLYVILGVCVATCGDGWLRSVKTNYPLSFFSKTSPSSVYPDRAVGSVNPLEPDTTCRINHDWGGGLGSQHGGCAASAMWTTCTLGLTWLIMPKHHQNQHVSDNKVKKGS